MSALDFRLAPAILAAGLVAAGLAASASAGLPRLQSEGVGPAGWTLGRALWSATSFDRAETADAGRSEGQDGLSVVTPRQALPPVAVFVLDLFEGAQASI